MSEPGKQCIGMGLCVKNQLGKVCPVCKRPLEALYAGHSTSSQDRVCKNTVREKGRYNEVEKGSNNYKTRWGIDVECHGRSNKGTYQSCHWCFGWKSTVTEHEEKNCKKKQQDAIEASLSTPSARVGFDLFLESKGLPKYDQSLVHTTSSSAPKGKKTS